jgi:Protein of unknown function (DUF4079)
MPRVIAFLHPLVAIGSILFLAWVASLGLRSRERVDRHLRPRHARLARWAYGLMVGNFVAGTITTWALRPDLTARGAMHFRLGLAIVVLMSGTAFVSPWVRTNETARLLHPLLGLLALVLAGLQVFFGMPLLPL